LKSILAADSTELGQSVPLSVANDSATATDCLKPSQPPTCQPPSNTVSTIGLLPRNRLWIAQPACYCACTSVRASCCFPEAIIVVSNAAQFADAEKPWQLENMARYSHSIVAGGLLLMS